MDNILKKFVFLMRSNALTTTRRMLHMDSGSQVSIASPQLIDEFGAAKSDHVESSVDAVRSMRAGVLPSQEIQRLISRKVISAAHVPFTRDQVQPASLDLRLGPTAYRIRASFLPGPNYSVDEKLGGLQQHEISLKEGAVLERGCVYLVKLHEQLDLPESISAIANPKSSTGRLDVFTRLITDQSEVFDYVRPRYSGPVYAEIVPRTFGIKVREGSRLNQLRFRRLNARHPHHQTFYIRDRELKLLHARSPLVVGSEPRIREGLQLRVDFAWTGKAQIVGYRAQHHTDVVDVDEVDTYVAEQFWEPIYSSHEGRLILNPHEFYILVSKESVRIPPEYSAEMVPIDPLMGEFRVHYAGFFDPGFGHSTDVAPGSRAVLEVRSYEVPFILEDGQIVGRLVYEPLTEPPKQLYGAGLGSHYQAQGLKLSKHFRQP